MRKYVLTKLCCLLCIFLMAKPTYALETATLVEACKDRNNTNFNFCLGYIGGIYEGVRLQFDYLNMVRLAQGLPQTEKIWCMALDASYEAMVSEFLKFIDDNPQYSMDGIYAEVAVYSFFSDRFNCS